MPSKCCLFEFNLVLSTPAEVQQSDGLLSTSVIRLSDDMLVADIKLRGGAILCVVPKGASAKSASNASPFVANLPSIDDSKVSAGASLTPRKSIKSTYKHSTPSSQSSYNEPLAEPS